MAVPRKMVLGEERNRVGIEAQVGGDFRGDYNS